MTVGRPWPKGVSGNSKGRPPGVRNLLTELEQLGRQVAKPKSEAELEKMPRTRRLAYVMWGRALDGDLRAGEHISDRLLGRPAQEVRWTNDQPTLVFQIIDPHLPLPAPSGDGADGAIEGEARELPPVEVTTEPGS